MNRIIWPPRWSDPSVIIYQWKFKARSVLSHLAEKNSPEWNIFQELHLWRTNVGQSSTEVVYVPRHSAAIASAEVAKSSTNIIRPQSKLLQGPCLYGHEDCHYIRAVNYRRAVAITVLMKPTIEALLPLQLSWSHLPKDCYHYIHYEANYQSAVATTVMMKSTTAAMLPLQLWWYQLPPRCCHYNRDEANYHRAFATTVVMKSTTAAMLPLQLWRTHLPPCCCHYNCDEANYQNAVPKITATLPHTDVTVHTVAAVSL